jgi:hypothetical protein
MNTCETGHKKVTPDFFARDLRVKRSVPGDCYCHECSQPVSYWWNGGSPIRAIKAEEGDLADVYVKASKAIRRAKDSQKSKPA